MGWNTAVLILNDGFDQLEKHPEQLVAAIRERMMDGGDGRVGCHLNAVQVMPTQHADVFRLYSSQGNAMVDLTRWSRATRELGETHPDLLASLIRQARWQLDDLEAALTEDARLREADATRTARSPQETTGG